MSCGIGIICHDGIVLGCDSASTLYLGSEMTRPDQGKYFEVTDRIQLVVTGGHSDGIRLVDEIQERLPERPELMSRKKFMHLLEDAALALHKRYNLDQDPPVKDGNALRYEGASLVCFGNVDGEVGLYLALEDGGVEIIQSRHPIGSLATVTEYLLHRLYRPDIDVHEGLRIAYYIISELIESDPHCGGRIRLGYLKPVEHYIDLKEEEILVIEKVVEERKSVLHDHINIYLFNEQFNFLGF